MEHNPTIWPVILSGGSGSRLWPKSRMNYPKQFLCIDDKDEYSLLQATAMRLQGLPNLKPPIVVSNMRHRFLIAEQLQQIDITPDVQILEPEGRNTAPAIAISALQASKTDPKAVLVVLPSDHRIAKPDNFRECVAHAAQIAACGKVVTFGIKATHPHTGYGYIEASEALSNMDSAFHIKKFTEKPDINEATRYYQAPNYFWNSGIFIARCDQILIELEKYQPDLIKHCQAALDNAAVDHDFVRLNPEDFMACPDSPFDIAVMEQCDNAVVIPADFAWCDVGSWDAIWQIADKDTNGNVIKGDAITENTENCYIDASAGVVATSDIKDLVIINTEDAVLVAPREKSEQVKELVKRMDEANYAQTQDHVKHYRPWGYYQTIESGTCYCVKRLQVKPGKRLSLQYHHHRAEHWVVVNGTAKILNGDTEAFLGPNESTYIPIGNIHRLENPGNLVLDIIEVQSGQHLSEDDIVRLEDDYNRIEEPKLVPQSVTEKL